MSINLFHNLNTIKTTGAALPLVFDAPYGVVLPANPIASTSPAASIAGMIFFDTNDKFLKYHNGTTWIVLGPTDGINTKADKQSAVDIGGAGYGPGKYLTSDAAGQTLWKDPAEDGFIAFNKKDSSNQYQNFTLSNNFLFTGANKFTQPVDMQNNIISNVVANSAQDAIPKIYVDNLVNQKVSDLNTSYAGRVATIEAKYSAMVHTILNTNVPNPPKPPDPPVPNPVRAYLIETGNSLSVNNGNYSPYHPSGFATDAHNNAIAQNGGRVPAAGSVYIYTYTTVVWTAGSKGASSSSRTTFAKFTWNGSSVVFNYTT